MGTNFYRLPKFKEVESRRTKLIERIQELDFTNLHTIEGGFRTIECEGDSWSNITPWEEFMEGMSVHLGKRSSGWKFCWNFHDNKFYSNKEELLTFIRSGRIIDEYGTLIDNEEFITMALEWGQPNGWDTQTYYKENPQLYYNSRYDDRIIDGLRVSSSTEFF
jgi:hypothetical protein